MRYFKFIAISFLFSIPTRINCQDVRDSVDYYINKLDTHSVAVSTGHPRPRYYFDYASGWLLKQPVDSLNKKMFGLLTDKRKVLAAHVILSKKNLGDYFPHGETGIYKGDELIGFTSCYNHFSWTWISPDQTIIHDVEMKSIQDFWRKLLRY